MKASFDSSGITRTSVAIASSSAMSAPSSKVWCFLGFMFAPFKGRVVELGFSFGSGRAPFGQVA